jgi:hypothetical protein
MCVLESASLARSPVWDDVARFVKFTDLSVISGVPILLYRDIIPKTKLETNRFDRVLVNVLVLDAKVRGFKSCRVDEFLKVIKIRSTTSFGGEVNQEDPRKILRHVKITCK